MNYGYNDFTVLPQDLQDFAWSAPMRDLAAKIGISDVGLKKILRSHGIVTPPQGHWNRILAGRTVPTCPRVAPRGPGASGRMRIDARFEGHISPAGAISSAGPFASPLVPEELDALYQQELKAIGRVGVPRSPDRLHHALRPLMQKEERRKQKFAGSGWRRDAPKFESPLERRRLRIFNALFLALARRGHGGAVSDRDDELSATAIIGTTAVDLDCDVADWSRARRGAPARDRSELPLGTKLRLSIDGATTDEKKVWQDDASGKLESKLAVIAASLITAGEAKFRRGLKEAEEREAQFRRWQEQRRLEEIARRNAERLAALRTSGDLLRQAGDLRALIARVREAVVSGETDVDQIRLEEWERWASAEADRIDPILSGQIMSHLGTV